MKPTIKNVRPDSVLTPGELVDKLLLGFNKDFHPRPESMKVWRMDHTKAFGVRPPAARSDYGQTIWHWMLIHQDFRGDYCHGALAYDKEAIEDMIAQGILVPYDLSTHPSYALGN